MLRHMTTKLIGKNFRCQSSLNGNNGEWTNGDDMPPKGNGNRRGKGTKFIQTMNMGSNGGKKKGGGTPTPSESDIEEHPPVGDNPTRNDVEAFTMNGKWHSTQTDGYDLFIDTAGNFRGPTELSELVMERYFPGDALEKSHLNEMSHFKLVRDIQECAMKLQREHTSMMQSNERHKIEMEKSRENLPAIVALRDAEQFRATTTAKLDEIAASGKIKLDELKTKIVGDNERQLLVNSGGVELEASRRVTAITLEKHKGEISKLVETLRGQSLIDSKTVEGDFSLRRVARENDGKIAVENAKGSFTVKAAAENAEGTIKAQSARAYGDIQAAKEKALGDVQTAEVRGKYDLAAAKLRATCQEASMMAAVSDVVDNFADPMARAATLYEVAQIFKNGVKPEAIKYAQVPPRMTADMHHQYEKLEYGGRRHRPEGIVLTRQSDGYVPANCLVKDTPWVPGAIADFKCIQDKCGDWRLEAYMPYERQRPGLTNLPVAHGYENVDNGNGNVTCWRPVDEFGAHNIRPVTSNARRWTHPHHDFISGKFIHPVPYGNILNDETIPVAGAPLSEVGIYYSAPDRRTWFQKFAGSILGVCLENDEDTMHRPVRNYHADLIGGGCKDARVLTSRFLGHAVGDFRQWTKSVAGFAETCQYTHIRTALISAEMAQSIMGSVDKTGLANSAFDSRFDTVQRAYVPLLQQANNRYGRFFDRELIENTCMFLAQTCALKAYAQSQMNGMSGVISRGEFITKPGGLP